MTCQSTNAETIYDSLVQGLIRARHAADDRNLDPDEVVTWMTLPMLAAVRNAEHTVMCDGFQSFHGHQVRFLKGPEMIAFSAHPKLV